MIIKSPTPELIPSMKDLWMEAFGDAKEFVDTFFETAYAPERCRVAEVDGEAASALYILDFELNGETAAYIYAVATAEKHRGRGICRALMEDTHAYLKERGYAFAVLKPGEKSLFDFYRRLGYVTCGSTAEVEVTSAETCVPVERIDHGTYRRLRLELMPENGADFDEPSMRYLASYNELYSFDGGIFTAWRGDGEFFSAELLVRDGCKVTGELLGGIVRSLGYERGFFRTVGDDVPFIMGYPLCSELPRCVYLGLAFD